MNKIIKYLKNPNRIILFLGARNIIPISDEWMLKFMYKRAFNKKLDLKKPKTFSEKLQWLKLYDRKDIYTIMVDKHAVKGYVSSIIGDEYVIPTYGVYDKFDDIDFEQLPNKFVIKCTHDSGGLVICDDKNKLNLQNAKRKISKCLKRNYFYCGREWPYKNVKSKILIEQYMEDKNSSDMIDYKFFCFNGEAKYCLVCSDRKTNLKETFFDLTWNIAPFKRPNHEIDNSIRKPKNLNLMIKLANKLSKDIPFLRVDFYEIDGKIFFGELTFFPAGGFNGFDPEEWDLKLGELIDLSKVDKNEK